MQLTIATFFIVKKERLMDQIKTYKVSTKVKVGMGIIMFILTFLILVIFGLMRSQMPILVPVILGIFFYLSSITTVKLTSHEMIVRSLIGRTKRYSYADGTFEVRSLSGIAAFLGTGKSSAKMIFFQKKNARRLALAVNGYFTNQDIEEIFAIIEERQKILE